MNTAIKPLVRCAIYTRKSTEEGLSMEYNSLEAQRDAAEAYIRSQVHEGWTLVQDRYDDPAYSGGNMERPALKRLMEDVKEGKVQMVVVYKIDRLSRSLMDFATLARLFEQHGASFTSVTEQFSTANAIGRLHLNMILSFAQFEREIASERIRDKVAASKRKGMWMGGHPPLGYDVVERKLIVNPAEAEVVRGMFKRFLEVRSLLQLAHELKEAGVMSKGCISKRGKVVEPKALTTSVIHHILRNHVYVGKIHHKGEFFGGQHEPIVPQELWQQVQDSFKTLPPRKAGRSPKGAHNSVLSGLVFCKCCKSAMCHTYTRKKQGRMYRYFTSSAVRRGASDHCAVGTVAAPELEQMVLGQIRALFRQPEAITEVWERLDEMGMPMTEDMIRRRLLNLDSIWNELFPAEQKQFIGLLVQRVEMTPRGASIHMHKDGLETLLRQLAGNDGEENRNEAELYGDLRAACAGENAADGWSGTAAGAA